MNAGRVAAVAAIFASVTASHAAERYVSAGSTNAVSPYDSWATAAVTIEAAVAVSGDGDLVRVDEGAYNPQDEITITNGVEISGFGAASNVVVNGSGSNRCFYISHSNAVVTGLTITGGVAGDGGGVLIDGGGRVTHCIIRGNAATDTRSVSGGGGVLCLRGGMVEHCLITGNRCAERGAGVLCLYDGTVRNCLVVGNTATNKAGGIACVHGGGLVQVQNCTVASNRAGYGGGFHASGGGICTIENTVVWANSSVDARFPNIEGDYRRMEFLHCCTPDLTDLPGTGNFEDDPEFLSVAKGDFHVSVASPCINAGTNGEWMATGIDFDDNARLVGPAVDVGVYELPEARLACSLFATPAGGFAPLRVELSAPVRGEIDPDLFYSWDVQNDGVFDVVTTNQNTIAAWYNAQGDFTASVTISNRAGATTRTVAPNLVSAIEPASVAYVSPTGASIPPYDTWGTAASSIALALDVAQNYSMVIVTNGSYYIPRPLQVDAPVILRSVNGAADTVINGSTAGRFGADRCISVSADGAVLEGFTIERGSPVQSGDGGGVLLSAAGILRNCVVRENHSDQDGGGVYCAEGAMVINSTICDNTANGSGVNVYFESNSLAVNCVISDSNDSRPDWDTEGGEGYLAYCCTTPLPSGIGNITNAPLLDSQFRLSSNSPCIDVGMAAQGVVADAFGTPRPLDGDGDGDAGWDIGAHEYIHPSADSDHDGIGDSDEVNQHGTSPVVADTDGDRGGDGHELVAGTDPLDPASAFIIHDERVDALGRNTVLSWPTVTGRLYAVVCSSNLTGAAWVPVPACSNLLGNGDMLACTNAVAGPSRFYRVAVRVP